MTSFLRRPRGLLATAPGKSLLSWSERQRSWGAASSGALAMLRASETAVGGRRIGGSVPFSSLSGGPGGWRYDSYQRPWLARCGDWACVGLTALGGGLFWVSSTSEEVSLSETPVHLAIIYGALKYSLKRKLLRLRLRWLRHKLVLKGGILQGYEQEHQAFLGELEYVVQDMEDELSYEVSDVSRKLDAFASDPFMVSAFVLLQKIDQLKEFVMNKPERSKDGVQHIDLEPNEQQSTLKQLLRLEVMVKELAKSHTVNEILISRNKELVAKVDDLLLKLEKEK